MPDLADFFKVVSGLLVEGGHLVIYETHPFLEMFDPKSTEPFTPSFSYFARTPFISENALVYDGSDAGSAPARKRIKYKIAFFGCKKEYSFHKLLWKDGKVLIAIVRSCCHLPNV